MSKKNNRTAIIAVAILLVLVVGAIIVWFATRPAAPEAGRATIVVSVTHGDGSEKEFTISTDAENLRGALEQENLIAGDESEYGLYVKTVDGETADDAKQEWWCFTKGGEMMMTGVDDSLIADGEHYEIVFTVGW
ncbi:MAG: DUF4430 domain-containing protein [Oscillospiraceae bacterium]|nr:DUF4430 domain-containing protein [Oscillospiraceae bacterium]